MLIRRLLLLLFSILLFSCTDVITIYKDIIDFSITSPRDNWTYYEDTKIMLAVNVNTNDILWTSDISGYLGEGNHLTLFLPTGFHRINAEIKGVIREQHIIVSPNASEYNSRTILINHSPLEIMAKRGNYYSYSYTNNGTVNDFRILPLQDTVSASTHAELDGAFSLKSNSPQSSDCPRIGIRLPMPQNTGFVSTVRKNMRSADGYNIGAKRNFFVVNTKNQLGVAHNLEAELIYQSEILSVWVTASDLISEDILNECMQMLNTHIIPRVESLWGKAADIDGDGHIALLFSHTINDEQLALGFFNPADFFLRNTDMQSAAYNPSSNEMDIIYVAIPDANPGSSYSKENIIVTIAHELTHASTFTVKTWNRLRNGDTSAMREELFLDEGWSHLTENLIGLGISGGNIGFLKRFLDNTSMYSFNGLNRLGQIDSAGMRGAITLFLSWLFWEAGGMSWRSANLVEFIDHGGIAFLQRMIALKETGWDSIGIAFGQPTNLLFNEMLADINKYILSGKSYSYRTDPLTGEAVDFFVNMGSFYYSGASVLVHIGFPVKSSIFNPVTLLPWSFVFYDAFFIPNDSFIILDNTMNSGSVFFSYSKIP